MSAEDVIELLKTSLQLEEQAFAISALDPITNRGIAEVVARNLQERQERWELLIQYDEEDRYEDFVEALKSLTARFTKLRRARIKERERT